MFPVLNVDLMKPEGLSFSAKPAQTAPVSPVVKRTKAERHQSVLVIKDWGLKNVFFTVFLTKRVNAQNLDMSL